MAFNLGVTANRMDTVAAFEVEKVRIVDDAGDDFANVVRLAIIDRDGAGEFLG